MTEKPKSQAGIILDYLHNMRETSLISALKRFGMKIRPCLNGTTELSDLALATNFLIVASKPSNLLEIGKYKELAALVFAFEEVICLLRQGNANNILGKSFLSKYAPNYQPGDKGSRYADIYKPEETATA